jgi:hypothetical protein
MIKLIYWLGDGLVLEADHCQTSDHLQLKNSSELNGLHAF